MKRNFCTGLLWMVFINIDLLMAIDVRHSPSIIGQRSVDDIFNQAKENSGGNNRDSVGRTPNTTLSPRPQPRINDGILRRATPDDRRQPINSAPGSYITTENNDPMMFPGMFWHPFASWGMRYANPMQRSMPPWWSMWYRMNPMLSFWNRFARYNEPAPARYNQYYGEDRRYQPGAFDGNFVPYPGDSQRRYSGYNQQPSTSLYYNNPPTGSSMQQQKVTPPSQQYYDEQPSIQQYQTTNSAQPSYSTQRIESNAQLPTSSNDYLQQSRTEPNIQIVPSSQNNIDRTRLKLQDQPLVPESQNNREESIQAEPIAQRVSTSQMPIYRSQPVKSNGQGKTNAPVTLVYYEDSLENQNGQSQDTPVSSTPENRTQRILSNTKYQGV